MNTMASINSSFFGGNTVPTQTTTYATIPASLNTANLRLWLDATDVFNNGFPPSSQNEIPHWLDKSRYGNTAVATTGPSTLTTLTYQPTGFNGCPCVVFPGRSTPKWIGGQLINNSAVTGVNAMYVFVVGANNSTTVGSGTDSEFAARFIGFSTAQHLKDYNDVGTFGFLRQSQQGLGPYRNGTYLPNDPPTYNFPTVWQAGYNGTRARASFLNGDSTVLQDAPSPTTANFTCNWYKVGCNTDYTDAPSYLTGRISEILVYSGVMADSDISKVEGYLAWKYGLQSLLPTAHTYKSAPPTS